MQICICRIRVKEWIKISDLLFFQEGPGVRNTQYTQSGVKLLNVANLVNGKVDLSTSDRYISEDEAYGRYKHFLCDDGDFIIASSGIKVEYFDRKMGFVDSSMLPLCMNTSTIRFKVIDSKRLNIKYFMYYLKSIHFKQQLSKFITGSAQLNFGPSHLKKMNMPLVSLKEQNDIVEKLSKVELLLDKYNGEIKLLDELIKARFVEMFGDPNYNPKGYKKDIIKDHIDLLSGYPFKSENYVDSGINICGGLVIMPQKIKWEECVHWKSAIGYENYLLNNNDIVMALDRPWISEGFKIAKVDSKHLPALLIQRTVRIRAIDMNQDYLYYCFICGGFNKHCNVTGSLVPHISSKDIKSFEVMLPPLELQNQFASFVEEIDKSRLHEQLAVEYVKLLAKDL